MGVQPLITYKLLFAEQGAGGGGKCLTQFLLMLVSSEALGCRVFVKTIKTCLGNQFLADFPVPMMVPGVLL